MLKAYVTQVVLLNFLSYLLYESFCPSLYHLVRQKSQEHKMTAIILARHVVRLLGLQLADVILFHI